MPQVPVKGPRFSDLSEIRTNLIKLFDGEKGITWDDVIHAMILAVDKDKLYSRDIKYRLLEKPEDK